MKATVSNEQNMQIETLEDGGWFRRAKTRERVSFIVSVFVDFTEEERATLTKYNLWETPVWSVDVGPSEYYNSLMRKSGLPEDHENVTLVTTIKELAAPPKRNHSTSHMTAHDAPSIRQSMR